MRVRARTLLAKLSRSKSRSRVTCGQHVCMCYVYGIITPDGLPVCRYLLRGFLDVRCSPPHAC